MKTTLILLHASVGDGWREIGDGVVENLHLDQKTALIKWNASCVHVGSELSFLTKCLMVMCERDLIVAPFFQRNRESLGKGLLSSLFGGETG